LELNPEDGGKMFQIKKSYGNRSEGLIRKIQEGEEEEEPDGNVK
jgi:hypothetical protein